MAEKKTTQQKALEAARFERPSNMNAAAKSFMKGVMKRYGADALGLQKKERQYIKSSSLKFNQILSGGWLLGRVYEMFGPESGGKTTWALDAIACAQQQYPDRSVLFVDAEASFDMARAAKLGVDTKKLPKPIVPPNGDAALDIIYEACMTGAFSVVVLDSVAALEASEEVIASVGEAKNKVGLSGKMMSQALKKIVRASYTTDTAVIFINQMRDKPGVMYGPTETTPGGRALKFYSSARIHVKQMSGKDNQFLDMKGVRVGHRIEMQVVKNKLGAPYRSATMDLYYFEPLDTVSELVELGIRLGILTNTGTTRKQSYVFNGKAIAEGEDELRKILVEDRKVRSEVMDAIEKAYVKPEDATMSAQDELAALAEEDPEIEDLPKNEIL